MEDESIKFEVENFKNKVGCSVSQKTMNMLFNATATLFKPLSAWLHGRAAMIEVEYLPFYQKLVECKERNLQQLAKNTIMEFAQKEQNGEPIPETIHDTDNLLLIQDNASTTSNEEFLKLWAKLYTEEACKPGSVSRKTIKLIETLDIDIVKLLENDIFPYCDANGFYWGNQEELSKLSVATDYGIMDNFPVAISPESINQGLTIRLSENYILFCYPNFQYSSKRKNVMYKLTSPGLEIYENIKIRQTKEQLDTVFKNIELSVLGWCISKSYINKIRLKNNVNPKDRFVICDITGNTVYPLDSKYKSLADFQNNAERNIEIIN